MNSRRLIAVAAFAALLSCRRSEPPAPAAPAPAPAAPAPAAPAVRVLATLPEFELQSEQGESVDLYDLHGKVWIADFIFTRCAGTCPLITRDLVGLSKELAASPAEKEVKLISFSVDPDFDRPEVLRDYAKKAGADWTFLTGTRDAVRGLVSKGFKLPVGDQDDASMPIFHSQNFMLVDRAGRVRGAYDALSADGRKDLKKDLAAVLAEPPPQDVFVPADLEHPDWLAARQAAQKAAPMAAPHDFQFTDQIGASGITFRNVSSVDVGKYYRAIHYDHGTAIAVADVDGDGKPDLYFVNQIGKNALYRNLGGGRFEDITESAGVGVGDRACVGAAFADIDNDGDPDLFVTSVRDGNLLFENDGHGHFKDITARANVGGYGRHSSGAIFFDYDGDGLLDLFVTSVGQYTTDQRREGSPYVGFADAFAGHLHPERSERSVLYHNLGGGQFEDVTEKSGLTHAAWSGDVTAFDYDADGRPDLYVVSMQGHDELWHNLGKGRFERVGRQVFPATPWGAMGVKVLDWNGDGKLDLFVTDMHTDMAAPLVPGDEKKKHDPATMFPLRFLGTDGNHVLGNALFTAEGKGKFDERSDAANVETGWPWGPSAGDLNADGWPDLFIGAGMNYPFRYNGSSLLLNEGGKRFADAEYVLGVEPRARLARPWFELECDGADARHDICRGESGPVLNDQKHSESPTARHGHVTVWAARATRSSAMVDLDGDGDLDIVANQDGDVPQILISDLAQRHPVHSLTVRLVGQGKRGKTNRDGIGALVTLSAAGRAQVQVNDGKSGYLAQSVMPLYFGFGDADHADSLKVRWTTGKEQTVRGPFKSGAALVVKEP
jgi:cytochrome oxidase Cu insertion factor (SCO1/SenC/PrrC family)